MRHALRGSATKAHLDDIAPKLAALPEGPEKKVLREVYREERARIREAAKRESTKAVTP